MSKNFLPNNKKYLIFNLKGIMMICLIVKLENQTIKLLKIVIIVKDKLADIIYQHDRYYKMLTFFQ